MENRRATAPGNVDVCDAAQKKLIAKYQAMDADALTKLIDGKEKELADAETKFSEEVEKLQKTYEKHLPADHLSKSRFLKWMIGNPLSGNKDYRGCARKRDLGGAGSPESREATGAMVGRGTEPPDEQPPVGSEHVGSLQGGLPRERPGILSKKAMSAAWLEFVAIR